jgi:peptide/nickel transport system ATP-binding protein
MNTAVHEVPRQDPAARGPLLEVRDLQIELITDGGVVRAVDGVSFAIREGETVTIIGESGSGKSTTAMGILRLLPDDLAVLSGHAAFAGRDVITDPGSIGKVRGRTVSLIPQDPMTALSPVVSIGRQLVEAVRNRSPELSAAQARSAAVDLLAQVRIPTPEAQLAKYPHQLSGGMLQRVLIAIALAGRPRLLVADEPTSALDVTVQAEILELLRELRARDGMSVLLISHDLAVIAELCDRVAIMKDGRVVEQGPTSQVVSAPASAYAAELLAAVPRIGAAPGEAGR